MILRCPKCKGKVKFSALKKQYWCWECEKHHDLDKLTIYNSPYDQRKGRVFNLVGMKKIT